MIKLVNIDYEQKLYSCNSSKIESNKINQEFEYLLFWLSPEAMLWTLKIYKDDYLNFIEELVNSPPLIQSQLTSDIDFWWGSFENIEFKKWVNSKATCWEVLYQHKLLPVESELLPIYPDDIKSKYLYKECTNFSGKGFVTDNLQALKKLKLPIIKEPLFDRKFDLSFLNQGLDGNARVIENIVDNKFQYKGTRIFPKFSFPQEFAASLTNEIVPILIDKLTLDRKEIWSIDSFIYQENDQLKLYPASEVNYRKTMGYVACQLQRKFAENFDYFEFIIRKQNGHNSKMVKNSQLNEKGGYLFLSPEDTYFQTFIVFGKTKKDFENIYQKLV